MSAWRSSATARLRSTGLLVALALCVAAPAAEARDVVVKWDHEDPSAVDHYLVFTRAAGQSYGSGVQVTSPPIGPDGAFYHVLSGVPDDVDVLTAIKAVDANGESPFSNERLFPAVPTTLPVYDSEGFAALAPGAEAEGWVDTGPDSSLTEDDSLFGILDVEGNRVFGTESTSSHIHSHYLGSGSAGLAAYEYSGRMRLSSSSGGIGVTAHSHYTDEDVYYRLLRGSGESFAIRRHPAGTDVACAADDTGVVPQANAWYRFRFRVLPDTGGTRISAKVWRQGDAEPSAWQIDCVDDLATRLTSGTFGMWTALSGGKYWDDLRVVDLGSADVPGDSEPPPPADEDPADAELGQPGKPTLISP